MNIWDIFFGWPYGGVWSNIIASIVWALPSLILVLWRQHKHHKRVEDSLQGIHNKLK